MTLDNEEAEIRVGQEVPFVTGQFTNTGANQGSVNPFQTIQREEVGTSLKITPQINEGSGVKLEIEQETSSLGATVEGAADLVTNTRNITTSVFVNDGEILVLGGLIDDQLRQTDQRVPGLGKIPGLGWLFRARKTDLKKTNLMVFIRPTILRADGDDARFLTNSKYRYIQDIQRQMSDDPIQLMRNEPRPVLPPLPEDVLPVETAPRRRTADRWQRTSIVSSRLAVPSVAPTHRTLPFAFAKRHGVLIQELREGGAQAIYRTGAAAQSIAEVRRFAGVPVRFSEVDPETFDATLQAAYESGAAMTMVEGLNDDTDLLLVAQQLPEPSDLIDSDDEAPIIRLINALLTQAVKDNASDIHIEPFENRMTVRFRIDGVLREVLQSKRAVAPLVVSRVKVMSKLDIAEKRLPQDGRISLRIAGRAVDVRVSTIPSGHGERVVLRLLDKQAGRLTLHHLGMSDWRSKGHGRARASAPRHSARHGPHRFG